MRYIARFKVLDADDQFLYLSEQDIETDHIWLDDPKAKVGNVELARRLVERQIVLLDGHRVVVTDLKGAPTP